MMRCSEHCTFLEHTKKHSPSLVFPLDYSEFNYLLVENLGDAGDSSVFLLPRDSLTYCLM